MIEAAAPVPAPSGGWRRATIQEVDHPTPHGVRLRLDVPDRVDHLPGQHYVVRLTAPDGYTAQRSYSVASPPSDPLVELYVERLEDGEVSVYLADVAGPGDQLDVRGPIGGWFVWRGDAPAVGVGGGSGVVPLVAMLRHVVEMGQPERLRLAVSSRTLADLPYAGELAAHGAFIATTREASPTGRPARRLSPAELGQLGAPAAAHDGVTWFVCGSAPFAATVSDAIVDNGVSSSLIRVERFGPSG